LKAAVRHYLSKILFYFSEEKNNTTMGKSLKLLVSVNLCKKDVKDNLNIANKLLRIM